jgi:phosphoribosylamine-glycine ligase
MTTSKLAVFVGYALLSNVEYFKKRGYAVGVIEDVNSPSHGGFSETTTKQYIDFVIPADLRNRRRIEKSFKGMDFHPDTILVCNLDKYFFATAHIAEHFKLKQSESLPSSIAKSMTNKFFQRKEFAKMFPEISPAYKRIRTFHGAYTFARKYGFPVIIKPANLTKGQLVNICNNMEELISKVSYVLDRVAKVYADNNVYRKPQVIIEEFITGRQYSVDSYVSPGGDITHTPVCKQVISHDLGFDDFQTYYSGYDSGLTQNEVDLVLDAVTKSIIALQIKGAPAHTEVKIKPDGTCQIVEVNVRTGGYRAQLLKESYQIDHIANAISCYTGDKVINKTELIKHSAAPQFWAEKEGVLKKVEGRKQIEQLRSYVSFAKVTKYGKKVGPVNKGYGRVAYAILAHKDPEVLKEDLVTIRDIVKFTID